MDGDSPVTIRPRWSQARVLTFLFVLSTVVAASVLGQGVQTDPAADRTFYAVSYVETQSSSTRIAIDALGRYRGARRGQDGFTQVEFFEQIGRPGHFAVVETWRDQQAFDARDSTPQRQLLASLDPVRVSGFDQRPYKTLTTGKSAATTADTIYVVTHVDVTPNPEVPPLLRKVAEESRKEAGNLRFDVYQHMMRANHFTVVEAWRNQQALDAHVAAAHTKQYRDTLQPLTGSPLDERVYKAIP